MAAVTMTDEAGSEPRLSPEVVRYERVTVVEITHSRFVTVRSAHGDTIISLSRLNGTVDHVSAGVELIVGWDLIDVPVEIRPA